jgi:hypothetical protein
MLWLFEVYAFLILATERAKRIPVVMQNVSVVNVSVVEHQFVCHDHLAIRHILAFSLVVKVSSEWTLFSNVASE